MRRGDLKGGGGRVIFSICFFSSKCVWLDGLGWGGKDIQNCRSMGLGVHCIGILGIQRGGCFFFLFLFLPHVCTP